MINISSQSAVGGRQLATEKFGALRNLIVIKPVCLALFTFSLLNLYTVPAVAGPSLTTGADFLLMTTGARPDGMGQAFSAVADDINTLSFNPAGLANIRIPEAGYGHENFAAQIGYDFVGAALPVGGLGVLGFGYIDMGAPPFNSTANPFAPNVSAMDQAFIAGWGRSFYNLHLGAAVKYITRQVDTLQGNGFGFDVGFRYRVLPYLTFAASALNLGPGIQLAGLEPLPTVLTAGGAWEIFKNPDHSLNLASDAQYDLNSQVSRYSVGAEYWYRDTVALRAGYLFNSQDEGPSAGAGVQVSFVQLDYAFQPFAVLGPVHRFSGILRWDGPWVSGGEPNPPKNVAVRLAPGLMEIRWDKARGPAQAYEVILQPLDGRDEILSPKVVNPIFTFRNITPDTLYKVSVRTVNGDNRSFPSDEAYVETPGAQDSIQKLYQEKGKDISKLSQARGVTGKVDPLGLQLSWEPPPGMEVSGYYLYRKSPEGRVERVTLEPKKGTRLWITDTSGLEGWEWIVTALSPSGKVERTVGSYLWFPAPGDMETLAQTPVNRLTATPEQDHKVFLDWDRVNPSSGYSLFISHKADGVYEFFKDVTRTKVTLLIKTSESHEKFYFIMIPKDPQGGWLKRSTEAKVDLFNPGDLGPKRVETVQ